MNFEKIAKNLLLWDQCEGSGFLSSLRRKLKIQVLRADLSNRIRYDPVLEHIKRHKLSSGKILEEGCGSVGITRYIKQTVTGADLNFQGPRLSYLQEVTCSAANLPFTNDEFDLAFSVDMLEHIPKDMRRAVITEMIRVSKEWIIIGVPCGEAAALWEQRAWKFWQNKIHKCTDVNAKERILRRGNFLNEHREHGLPLENEITSLIHDASNSKIEVTVLRNQSILIWYVMALASLRFNYVLWLSSIIIGRIFSPILRRVKWRGFYRKFFIVRKIRSE